jgi:hypothetical protein
VDASIGRRLFGKDLKNSADAKLWAGCVAGALLGGELIGTAEETGPGPFHRERFECFVPRREKRFTGSWSAWSKLLRPERKVIIKRCSCF